MEIVDNQAVKFRVKSDRINLITDYLEKSEVVEDNGDQAEVLVYWGIKEMQHMVKVCGDKVPSPMQRDYTWPGNYRLIPFTTTTRILL